jgi:hypothetical protein
MTKSNSGVRNGHETDGLYIRNCERIMYQEVDYKNKPIHLVIQQHSKTFIDQVLLHEVSLKSSKNTLTLSVGLDKVRTLRFLLQT